MYMSSTVQRVHELESRLEESQKQVQEYAEKLQEERQLKRNDGQHQKDINANNKKHKQEIARLQTNILQLQAQNDQLNEQVNNAQSQSSGHEQIKSKKQIKYAFMIQIQNLKTNQKKKDADYDNKIKELEALNAQQRRKFNDFYEQYKKKLEQSNKAGREYRQKCIVLAADTDALRKRIAELEVLLKQKEAELEAARKREKELLEQLATQERVFRIQLKELGQFIKEMKQREQVREKQQVEAYQKLLKEREAWLAKVKESKSELFISKKNVWRQQISTVIVGANSETGPAFDKKTEAVRTKFGNEKMITTWYYTGKDRTIHEVILRHNTKINKDFKSKRVIVVDGKVRYADKSKETHFIIKNGQDQLKLNISLNNNGNVKGFAYQLFINDVPYAQIANDKERKSELFISKHNVLKQQISDNKQVIVNGNSETDKLKRQIRELNDKSEQIEEINKNNIDDLMKENVTLTQQINEMAQNDKSLQFEIVLLKNKLNSFETEQKECVLENQQLKHEINHLKVHHVKVQQIESKSKFDLGAIKIRTRQDLENVYANRLIIEELEDDSKEHEYKAQDLDIHYVASNDLETIQFDSDPDDDDKESHFHVGTVICISYTKNEIKIKLKSDNQIHTYFIDEIRIYNENENNALFKNVFNVNANMEIEYNSELDSIIGHK